MSAAKDQQQAEASRVDSADFGPPRYPGDKRPPFAPGNQVGVQFSEGNTASVTHGATSPRTVQPVADRLEVELARIAPWTASEAFAGARRSWAWAEAQAALLRTYLDQHGHFDVEGEERPAVRTLDKVEARLHKARAGLGLDPSSLARLMAGAAAVASATGDTDTVATLAAEGSRILASRLANQPAATTTDPTSGDTDARPDH